MKKTVAFLFCILIIPATLFATTTSTSIAGFSVVVPEGGLVDWCKATGKEHLILYDKLFPCIVEPLTDYSFYEVYYATLNSGDTAIGTAEGEPEVCLTCPSSPANVLSTWLILQGCSYGRSSPAIDPSSGTWVVFTGISSALMAYSQSASGNAITFYYSNHGYGLANNLYLTNMNKTSRLAITDFQVPESGILKAGVMHPTWSSDGKYIMWSEIKDAAVAGGYYFGKFVIKIVKPTLPDPPSSNPTIGDIIEFDPQAMLITQGQAVVTTGNPGLYPWVEAHDLIKIDDSNYRVIFSGTAHGQALDQPDIYYMDITKAGADGMFTTNTGTVTRVITNDNDHWYEHAHKRPGSNQVWYLSKDYMFPKPSPGYPKSEMHVYEYPLGTAYKYKRMTYFNDPLAPEYQTPIQEGVGMSDNSWNVDGTKLIGYVTDEINPAGHIWHRLGDIWVIDVTALEARTYANKPMFTGNVSITGGGGTFSFP